MTATYIRDAMLVRPGRGTAPGSLLLQHGRITAINPASAVLPSDCEVVDADGRLLTPGLIDVHTHGIHSFPYEGDAVDLIEGTALLARYGTTCVLPTLYKVLTAESLDKIERLTKTLDQVSGVCVPGFHFEGPFLAIPGAGARTLPGDLGLLEELLGAANGRVSAMSISPECPNILPIIERLASLGIAVFMTHTRATVRETQAAIDAGARHATHFYDVFPLPPETDAGVRPVGAVETVLADERCTVDFICDGVHVDPMAIRAALAAKQPQGVVAITDSNVGAGLAEGVYDTPWGYKVKVSANDAARVYDEAHPLHGVLAGSSLTMNQAIENLQKWLRLPAHEIWAMGTCNPARIVGLNNKGLLEDGADADVVLWDERDGRLTAVRTWVNGACVYSAVPELAAEQPVGIPDHERLISI